MGGMVELPLAERWLYYTLWTYGTFYSLYSVYQVSYARRPDLSDDLFVNQWNFITQEKDISDFEWDIWNQIVKQSLLYYIGHIIIGQLIRWMGFKHRKWVFCAFGMLAVQRILGTFILLFILGLCLVMYLAAMTGSLLIVWTASISALSMLNFRYLLNIFYRLMEDDGEVDRMALFLLLASFLNLRYTSFCAEWCMQTKIISSKKEMGDRITDPKKDPSKDPMRDGNMKMTFSPIDMLAYMFYFPTMFTGPMMNYDKFCLQLNAPLEPWTWQKVAGILRSLIKVLFWAAVVELSLHYMYLHALTKDIQVIKTLPLWALAGLAYGHGQFFMIKYVVMFGLPHALARIDQITPPAGPKCIARIHRFSDNWKYFDRGFHAFVKQYIYIPMGGSRAGIARQLWSTTVVFLFIYYWHGAEDFLAVWAALNYVEIVIETIAAKLDSHPAVVHHLYGRLSPVNIRRMKAALTIPPLIWSIIGWCIFLMGIPVGTLVSRRFMVEGFPGGTLVFVVTMYAMVQTSIDIQNWELRTKRD